MAQYHYRARKGNGQEVSGALQAASKSSAAALLSSNGLTPIDIELTKASLFDKEIFSGVRAKDLVLFSRQLSAMIRSGVPILEAVRTMQKQVEKSAMRKILEAISYDIEGGESFSNALAKHPETFSLFYLGVVKTGEVSGRLSQSLDTIADYLDQSYTFNHKVRSALMYPVFVLSVVVVVAIVMFSFVMPQLVALFDEASVDLPLVTRILIGVTNIMQTYWYILLTIIVAAGALFRYYIKTPEGQYTVSSGLLYTPILSQLFRKVYLARLTSILHTLFSSDVPVIEALSIAKASLSNKVYQRILDETAEAVRAGASISSVWQHEPFIPPMLTTMVDVGERSGEIEESFKEANAFFKRDVDEILGSVTTLLEPLLVIILGLGVGFIVAAVLLPIYNLVLVL